MSISHFSTGSKAILVIMIKIFLQHLLQTNLFWGNQKILLTVSGGIDSMVMAHLFKHSGIDTQIGIAHCNFGLRGNESDADEKFVEQVAQSWKAEYFVKKFNTRSYMTQNKMSVQVAARELRYRWFEELIRNTDFDFYATAHNFDDQMETFFINLLRGTGVSGLRGIQAKNGNCIRPLLFAPRKMIEQYASVHNIQFREDSSNIKKNYLRNRIRHYVLPALENAEKEFRKGFQNTFGVLAQTEQFIEDEIAKKRLALVEIHNTFLSISIEKLKQEKNMDFVLFNLLSPFNFNYSNIFNINASLGKQSGTKFLSSTHELVIDRGKLLISEITHKKEYEEYDICEGVDEVAEPIKIKIKRVEIDKSKPIQADNNIAFLDLNKLTFPLKIRKFQRGDVFYPLGMCTRKKLSDFFVDQKISLPAKRNIWLLCSGDEIAWIIGHRIDDRFKITDKTATILILSLI